MPGRALGRRTRCYGAIEVGAAGDAAGGDDGGDDVGARAGVGVWVGDGRSEPGGRADRAAFGPPALVGAADESERWSFIPSGAEGVKTLKPLAPRGPRESATEGRTSGGGAGSGRIPPSLHLQRAQCRSETTSRLQLLGGTEAGAVPEAVAGCHAGSSASH